MGVPPHPSARLLRGGWPRFAGHSRSWPAHHLYSADPAGDGGRRAADRRRVLWDAVIHLQQVHTQALPPAAHCCMHYRCKSSLQLIALPALTSVGQVEEASLPDTALCLQLWVSQGVFKSGGRG